MVEESAMVQVAIALAILIGWMLAAWWRAQLASGGDPGITAR